jgi:hypothetical protein
MTIFITKINCHEKFFNLTAKINSSNIPKGRPTTKPPGKTYFK